MLQLNNKRMISLALALLLAVSACFTALAQAGGEKEPPRFSILNEKAVAEAQGLTSQEWDRQMDRARSAGLQDPVVEDQLKSAVPDAEILRQNGKIYAIHSSQGLAVARDAQEAYRYVSRLNGLLEGSPEASLRLWSVMTMGASKVYVFQQVFEGLTVVAGTVRLVTDGEGRVTAVFSSLASAVPHGNAAADITAAQAEDTVRRHLTAQGHPDTVQPEYTYRAIIPVESDMVTNEVLPDRLVYVVYSRNPGFGGETSVDLPFLAHFISMDGTYLRSCSVTAPDDRAVKGGYSAVYAFEFMEKSVWSGEVRDVRGRTRSLTVPVMRDTRTGAWYLGDPERKIAVGDFASLAYGDRQVVLLAKNANEGWDDNDLITYDNLIRVWDFYAGLGWKGADGAGTPILLLRNMCDEQGNAYSNAAYGGLDKGWQCFAYGGEEGFSQALDVMAHEFTHAVTSTAMNTSLYQDDMGAINEAMSDIMGKLCEMTVTGKTESSWLIAQDSLMTLRSMLHPHEHEQPEYVWDMYYVPGVDNPSDVNDRGGVHCNSSILNMLAARLCSEYGMPTESAVKLWLTVAFTMTPKTDYQQLAELMRWALSYSGNGAYKDALESLLEYSRMEETGLPEKLPDGQRVVTLTLPDTEAFEDPNWILIAFSVDTQEITARARAVWTFVTELFRSDRTKQDRNESFARLAEALHLNGEPAKDDASGEEAPSWLSRMFSGLVSQHVSWQAAGGRDVTMVLKDRPGLYLLMNFDPQKLADPEAPPRNVVVLLDDEWFDLDSLADDTEEELSKEEEQRLERLFEKLFNMVLNAFSADTEYPEQEALPTLGLENVTLKTTDEAPEEVLPAA